MPTMTAAGAAPRTTAQATAHGIAAGDTARFDSVGNTAIAQEPHHYREPHPDSRVADNRVAATPRAGALKAESAAWPHVPLDSGNGPFIATPAVAARQYAAEPAEMTAPQTPPPVSAPRARSLFQRITGTGRHPAAAPAAPAAPLYRRADERQNEAAQARSRPLPPHGGPGPDGAPEDDYDIPAFLRRQAN